jgi:hypothetical protein
MVSSKLLGRYFPTTIHHWFVDGRLWTHRAVASGLPVIVAGNRGICDEEVVACTQRETEIHHDCFG